MNDTPDSSSCHIILNKHIQVIKDIPIKGKNDILNWYIIFNYIIHLGSSV